MEKLRMKALGLGISETLSREQMKNVHGGTGCHVGSCVGNNGEGGYCVGNGINTPCQCYTASGYQGAPACYSN